MTIPRGPALVTRPGAANDDADGGFSAGPSAGRPLSIIAALTRLVVPPPQTALSSSPALPLVATSASMAEEMRQVDAVIQRRLASKVALIDQIAT